MKQVSVIIPVYNVEEYLPRCLNSVLTQTYGNLEILCVNDNTPDNCGQILDEYARKDDRISVITHNANKGLSGARNSGMRVATGDYIYFLDSDDYIDADYIEKMVEKLEENGSNMVLNLNIVSEDGINNSRYIHPTFKKVAPQGELVSKEKAIHALPFNVWARLYKKTFLDACNVTFPEGYVNEDVYFHYVTHIYCDSAWVFIGPQYHYTSRCGSITKKEPNLDLFITKIYDLIFDYFVCNRLVNKFDIKMFHVFPYFMVDTEEKFNFYSGFFKKIQHHIKEKKYLYNELELFFVHNILGSKTIEEYAKRFPPSVALSFIRRNRQIDNAAKTVK